MMMSAAIKRRRDSDLGGIPNHVLPPRKTPAEIIGEARQALHLDGHRTLGGLGGVTRVGVKTVHTRRPFTPREKERTLFGDTIPDALRLKRPPSSFTLSPLQFDSNDVLNRSAKLPRMQFQKPASGKFLPVLSVSANDVIGESKRPPLDRHIHRHQFRTVSLSDLPEENEENEEVKQTNKLSFGPFPRSLTSPVLQSLKENFIPHRMAVDDSPSPALEAKSKDIHKRAGIERNWKHVAGRNDIWARIPTETSQNGGNVGDIRSSPSTTKVNQVLYFEEKISPILDEIERALSCGVDDEVIIELVEKLYNSLETAGLLGRHFQFRTQVLKSVFRLVERENGYLLANLIKIMLMLKVSGSNLTSVCKLIFKVTRHDCNDAQFLEGNLLDLVLEAIACTSPIDQAEACVYGYGALKFLTMNSKLVCRLLHRGVLELLVLHMKIILAQKQETGNVPEQTNYALLQLTGTLRHVSSCERAFPLMLVTGAVEQVCRLLQLFYEDPEISANVVRVLSIISTQEECCAAAADVPGTLAACIHALKSQSDKPAVVVRLAYALGNMLTSSDKTRWEVFCVEGFSDTIMTLLSGYLQKNRDEEANCILDPLTPGSGSAEDVLIKLIRVLANISVHPKIGPELAHNAICLKVLVSIVAHKSIDESEELVLSALATLNNLTFYSRVEAPTSLHKELAEGLCDRLPLTHAEGLIETIRVFGNLTHSKQIRDILSKSEVLEALIEMLDCDSRELVFVCSGVLVNMMNDVERRIIFRQENGVQRMMDVLQYFGYGDWQLCSLECQVLWNFCAGSVHLTECFSEREVDRLIIIMEEFLDEDTLSNPEVITNLDPNQMETMYAAWEDFAVIATKLLDRLDALNLKKGTNPQKERGWNSPSSLG